MSHGWRSILAGREILKKGLGWIVGSGDKIRVWQDPWLSCEKPVIPVGPANQRDTELRVSDLLCPISNEWDRDKIRQYLPQYEDSIRSLVTSSAPSIDNLAWLPDKSGIYTSKTGYGIGMTTEREDASSTSKFNWLKNIWNIKTSPKIKDFLWKVVKKAIPVSSNLATRGVPAFSCKSCDMGEDDLHVFLHCKVAEQVWSLAPLVNRPTSFTSMASFIASANQLTVLPPHGCISSAVAMDTMESMEGKKQALFRKQSIFRYGNHLKVHI